MFGWVFESFYANPADYGSTYIITGRFETVTVSSPTAMLEVSKRVAQSGPITIRQVFPDGSGRWIVPPVGCVPIIKPPGPPVAQPEPEPMPLEPEEEEEEEDYDLSGYFVYQPQGSDYEAHVWYWLMHNHNLSGESAARQVALNREWIEQMWDNGEDAWDVAKQLSRLRFGHRYAPRKKRQRRPTWECPMPQTLLVADVDVISETKRLITVVPDLRTAPMPHIYVRRNTKLRGQHGAVVFTRNHIRLTDAPEIDRFEVLDTLSHELAHLNVHRLYKDTKHSPRWRAMFEHIARFGYGVEIKVSSRHSGELAAALRGKRGPARECTERT